MKDLIDRETAIKEIEKDFAEVLTSNGYDSYKKADLFYKFYCDGLMKAIGILLDMEAEQPSAEPKTGRWIDEHFADEYLANCSECGYEMNVRANHGYFNYCPNCGAKMEVYK